MGWDQIEAKRAAVTRDRASDLSGRGLKAGPEEDPVDIPPGDPPEPSLPEIVGRTVFATQRPASLLLH
jgi:hypothetical protein